MWSVTAIIGHRSGWMVSDSRETMGDRIVSTVAKKMIKLGDHTLVGAAGDAGFEFEAREALIDAAQDRDTAIDVLRSWIKENLPIGDHADGYHLVVVNNKQELWDIDSKGAASLIDAPFWCIGSGGLVCQSYLEGVMSVSTADQVIRMLASVGERAILHASRTLTSIGGPVQTLFL